MLARVHLRPSRRAQEILAQAFIDLEQRETLRCFTPLSRAPGEFALAAGEL